MFSALKIFLKYVYASVWYMDASSGTCVYQKMSLHAVELDL